MTVLVSSHQEKCEPDNSLEFSGRHLDHSRVVSLRNTKVLLVQVHQLHLVVGDLLLVGALEHEGYSVPLVLSLDGDDVIIGGAPGKSIYSQRPRN